DEDRFFCFGKVKGGVMTVRFTDREGIIRIIGAGYETFEKGSISFKFKDGEKFNRRNTLSILRIKF
ncbi:MAG: BrnT family toxin, partial [Desulfobacterales bacterium]|nr:BrnT family toxin [Desulfobacterales bacterium]